MFNMKRKKKPKRQIIIPVSKQEEEDNITISKSDLEKLIKDVNKTPEEKFSEAYKGKKHRDLQDIIDRYNSLIQDKNEKFGIQPEFKKSLPPLENTINRMKASINNLQRKKKNLPYKSFTSEGYIDGD